MHVIYSRTGPIAAGQAYQNPRHFTGPLPGATSVTILGDYPAIAAAYAAAGVPVIDAPPAEAAPALPKGRRVRK